MADTIVRRLRTPPFDGSAIEYAVYQQHEADRLGITYHDDYRAAEPGEWILTADGWVGELLIRKESMTHRPSKGMLVDLTFSFAKDRFIVQADSIEHGNAVIKEKGHWGDHIKNPLRDKLEYLPYKYLGHGYHSPTPMSWVDDILRRTRGKIAIQMFADRLIAGDFKLREDDFHDIGKVLEPNAKVPAAKAKLVYKQPKVKEEVIKKTSEYLSERGLDMGFVLDVYKDAITVAENTGNAKNMIDAADRIREVITTEEKSGGVEANWELLEAPAAEEPKFLPERLEVADESDPHAEDGDN